MIHHCVWQMFFRAMMVAPWMVSVLQCPCGRKELD